MSLELLVAFTCLSSNACDKASKAYYASQPELHRTIRQGRLKLEAALGKQILWAAPIAYTAATGKAYQIRITRHFSLGQSKDRAMMALYTREF